MNVMAYVNIWDSECNESYKFYLPIMVENQEIVKAVHEAVCEELEMEETDWKLINCSNPYPYLYAIVMASTVSESILVYSVKFSF